MATRSASSLQQSILRLANTVVRAHNPLAPALFGIIAACICVLWNHHAARMAGDFTWPLRGAQLLLHGQDPYRRSLEPLPYHDFGSDPLFYPLPLVLLFVPLAWLPDVLAGGVAFGIVTALMVWGLQQAQRSVWAFVLSPMFVAAMLSTNLSPLVVAGYVVPALLPLCVFKPQFLLAGAFVHKLRALRRGLPALVFVGLLTLISFVVLPTWPLGWFHTIARAHHPAPASLFGIGLLLLLPLVRPRMPDARFFVAFVCTPQLILAYDQLPLLLLARTRFEILVMQVTGWMVVLISVVGFRAIWPWYGKWLFLGIFFPALYLVMTRRNPDANEAPQEHASPATP